MKPISVIAAPNAEREASDGLELQLVSRKDAVSRSGRAPSAPHNSTLLGQSTEGKRGARPYVAGLEVARPNEAAYSVRAPRNSSALEPSATAKGSGDSRGVALVDSGAEPHNSAGRPSIGSGSTSAPRNIWLTPTLTAEDADRWLTGLQSVTIYVVLLFAFGLLGWNAHTISAWLYTHAQGIVGALFGGGK